MGLRKRDLTVGEKVCVKRRKVQNAMDGTSQILEVPKYGAQVVGEIMSLKGTQAGTLAVKLTASGPPVDVKLSAVRITYAQAQDEITAQASYTVHKNEMAAAARTLARHARKKFGVDVHVATTSCAMSAGDFAVLLHARDHGGVVIPNPLPFPQPLNSAALTCGRKVYVTKKLRLGRVPYRLTISSHLKVTSTGIEDRSYGRPMPFDSHFFFDAGTFEAFIEDSQSLGLKLLACHPGSGAWVAFRGEMRFETAGAVALMSSALSADDPESAPADVGLLVD